VSVFVTVGVAAKCFIGVLAVVVGMVATAAAWIGAICSVGRFVVRPVGVGFCDGRRCSNKFHWCCGCRFWLVAGSAGVEEVVLLRVLKSDW
jgi:hypothetical protein